MNSSQTIMLDVFMLLLMFFMIQPTGVHPTYLTESYEKKLQQANSGATINQGIKIKRLTLVVKKDAYYVRGQKMSLAAIKTMLINEQFVAIEVSAAPNALHRTVTRVENIANKNHIRIFEVPT